MSKINDPRTRLAGKYVSFIERYSVLTQKNKVPAYAQSRCTQPNQGINV
jgi:hypothetical protein